MTVPSSLFFSPIFFASIGIKTELGGMTPSLLVFSLLLLIVAILSKIIGCGLGAKLCRYSTEDAFHIGIGMVSRGEVALIVSQKGLSVGLLDPIYFASVILMIIVSSVATPIIMKLLYRGEPPAIQENTAETAKA